MCRLFGMLSVRASNGWKYLLEDPCSLYIQSKANPKRLQSDGWGIGFYMDRAPHLIKSEKPVYEEYENFASAVRQASSKMVLAHIRRASNPRVPPREKIVSIENSQPFMYENYLFVHNGTITIPDEVAETLGEWKLRIKGLNDSEVYFLYVVKEMMERASLPEALKKFGKTLSELWEKNREKHPNDNRPYIGLNALFSDGEKLFAYCKFDEEGESSKSLCFKDQPVFQMSYLINPRGLVVTSERTNREDEWKPLESGQLLTGHFERKKVHIGLQEIE